MQSLWMLLAGLLFACMGVCVKLGAARFPAGELVFYRGLVSLLIMAVWLRAIGGSLRTPHWQAHLWRSLSGFLSLVLYFLAISALPLATAATLNYTSPLFLALLLAFWVGERVTPAAVVGLAVGFLGVALLLRPVFAQNHAAAGMMGLASGALAGVAFLNVRNLGALGEPEWRVVFYFSLVSTLGALPWLAMGEPLHRIDARDAWLLLGVGGFGAAAQLAMTRAYRYGATLVSAALAYSTVVFSSLFGALVWDEVLPGIAWVGIGLVVACGLLVSAHARPATVEH